MEYQHKELANGRWQEFSFLEQMANIGSEVERAIKWKNKNNSEFCRLSFERALELLDFTVASPKNKRRLKELLRLRETLVDYFAFDNIYGSSDEKWHKYFYAFSFSARRQF